MDRLRARRVSRSRSSESLSQADMALKHRYFIDSHKLSNAPVILAMMAYYGAMRNSTAWVYLGLHGAYGLLWFLKSRTFGDAQWEKPITFFLGAGTWAVLSLYWIAPWMIASRGIEAPAWFLGVAIAVYAVGVFFHFASDMQKHTALRTRPGVLITDGLWGRTRNPNYFGELLIYVAFTSLAMHWIPLAALGAVVAGVWVPNMLRKDASLSRYPDFAAYKARTKLFVPFVI
jgi:steroid 5-alpha reductase family enzyme